MEHVVPCHNKKNLCGQQTDSAGVVLRTENVQETETDTRNSNME